VYAAQKLLQEQGDKLGDVERGEIDRIIEELQKAIADKDAAQVKSLMDRLNERLHGLSSKLSQQHAGAAAGQAPPSEDGQSPSSEDDIVDAEYEVKDESRKD